ncbi:MAG: LysM peptidoglycan-binding domain-containing protein [Dyella sp.]
MKRLTRLLPLAISLTLAACADVGPIRQPSEIRPLLGSSISHVDIEPSTLPAGYSSNDWDDLRASFAMDDCADPAALSMAHEYTRNPQRFEAQMREVLPRVAFIQGIAKQHGVPGEFVLLPWVESQFRPMFGRRDRPAGMWQIMPATASSIGLRIDGHYDGRLDVPAAAEAVMTLLQRYHDQLHDWRLVNYAFNAGEFSIQKLVDKHGVPAAEPVIPKFPVRSGTREHLVKLLAISCVIREPARFDISLPLLAPDQQLVAVPVPKTIPIGTAASQAGMSVDELYSLNAGLRDGIAGKPAAPYLLMPRDHAQQLQQAWLQPVVDEDQQLPSPPTSEPDALPKPTSQHVVDRSAPGKRKKPQRDKAASTASAKHVVGKGESLWGVAQRYHVEVSELQSWNHLQGTTLKPGQSIIVKQID